MVTFANTGSYGRIITLERAEVLFEPHRERLVACMRAGWADWFDPHFISDAARARAHATTRANMVCDFILHHARLEFAGVEGVTVEDDPRAGFVAFGTEAAVRFKKADSDLNTSNIATARQSAWDDQNPEGVLDGLPPYATLVSCVYVLNLPQTEIERICLTCRTTSSIQSWNLPLYDATGAENLFGLVETEQNEKAPPRVEPITPPAKQRNKAE